LITRRGIRKNVWLALRPPGEALVLSRNFHLFAFFNKKRDADFEACFQFGRFGHGAARRIAFCAWLGVRNGEFHELGQFQTDRVAVKFVQLNDRAFDEKIERVADHIFRQRESLEAVLIEEVRAIVIAVQIRGGDKLHVRLFEFVVRFECLLKDGAGEKIAHLEAHQRLPAARSWGIYLGFEADERYVLVLKQGPALHVDCIDQNGHNFFSSIRRSDKLNSAMSNSIQVGPLRKNEVAEADRIVRVAFGTFLGVPDPAAFMGDRDFMTPRWRSRHVKVIAAREGKRLIGTNVVTRWGSFGYFGPLTVLPEYWDRGVAQRLLDVTMTVFDEWGVRHTGLFTFAASAKHVGLYQKFGYWPRYLTALMTRAPQASAPGQSNLLSALNKAERERAIPGCAGITDQIDKGLDLSDEIREVLAQRTGDVVLVPGRAGAPVAFAICLNGPGSEGGVKTCYVKFGAVRGGAGAGERFEKLLAACESFATARGLTIEAGVNLARQDAFQRMRARGYRVTTQGVAMQRPHAEGFNRPDVWVIDDWR
jgi:hypothetical protein